jgi:hypothetical protein
MVATKRRGNRRLVKIAIAETTHTPRMKMTIMYYSVTFNTPQIINVIYSQIQRMYSK